ncbi:MAG TPA: hypothetical protein VF909_16705 [Roseiflexaceae bacterium]
MSSSPLANLISGLDKLRGVMLDGARDGLEAGSGPIEDAMRRDSAHGDVTGATHAAYVVFVVGRGESGADAMQQSISAVERLNPGHVATSSVHVESELGVIYTVATDYQPDLETNNAGEKAVLGPTLARTARDLTAAAAAGSRKALNG